MLKGLVRFKMIAIAITIAIMLITGLTKEANPMAIVVTAIVMLTMSPSYP